MDDAWEPLVAPDGPPAADALWWCVQGGRVLLAADGSVPSGAVPGGAITSEGLCLGRLGGRECWAATVGRGG